MQAKVEDQQSILRVSQLDLQLASLNQKIKTLPESIRYHEINLELQTTRDLRIAAETELSDLSSEINRAENDVEQVAKRIERDETRLSAGQGSPKELEQMQHELISLNARRAELEEVELEVMLRADGIKARITELKANESRLQSDLAAAETARDLALANLNDEVKETQNSRNVLIPQIEKALVDLYEKIRANGAAGAAKLANGQCTGCNLSINAGDLAKIMALAPEEVARCEECRCILVR